MDKIIGNGYRCSCNGMSSDSLVKVVQGNDITLDIQLTKHNTDTDTWESYSLLDKEGVQVYLLTPNYTHIDLDTEVQLDGKVKAKAESYQLETNMTYGIGVDWQDEGNDLSVKAKGMVKVVRYSEVTEDYDIEVDESATYISMGQLPQDAITPDELTVVLGDYVTNSSLDTTLNDYVQDSELDNYVTDSDLSTVLEDYVSDNELSSALSNYVTATSLNTTLQDYVTNNDLSDYVTQTSLTTTLNDYVTDTELATSLNPYVTSTSLSTTLQDYVTVSDNENQNEAISNSLVSLNSRVTTLEQNPGGGTGDVTMSDLDNYLEATAASLVEQEHQIDSLALLVGSINSNLSNYVTITDNENQNEAISNTLVSLDSRVTTIEQNPSVPSNVVTSDDANEIVLLTQSEYDALVNGGTVDPDALYYITGTNSNYVTNSQMTAALADYALETDLNSAESDISSLDTRVTALENGGGGGGTPTNMVTTDTTQTISGTKTFTANNIFNGESKFINTQNNYTVSFSDNCYEIAKSGIFGRGSFIQACIGQILAPRTAVSNFTNKYDNQVGTILFQTINGSTGSPNYNPSSLTTIAKIDSNGIYEGTTLLANKYVQSSSIRNIVQISQSDYDNLVNGGIVDANTMYVIV